MKDTIHARRRNRTLRRSLIALALLSVGASAHAATCVAYNPGNKANKLYLLYPTAPLTYPSFGFSAGSVTNPAAPFSAADLLCAGPFAWFGDQMPATPAILDWVRRCQDRESVRTVAER